MAELRAELVGPVEDVVRLVSIRASIAEAWRISINKDK